MIASDLKSPELAIAARLQAAELRAGRERAGLTHVAVAERLGVAPGTWRKWIDGRRQAPEAVRDRLAAEWGLDRARLGLEPDTACPCCGQPYG